MQITVRRSSKQHMGTHWRPAEHSIQQRETIELVRREIPGDRPNKLIHREQDIRFDPIDLLLLGSRRDYTDARIEDPYRRGRFVEGFVYVRSLAAFIHKDEVDRIENIGERIGPGAIIAKSVRIEPSAQIGAYAELERGARVKSDAVIGSHTVLRKGAHVDEGATIGTHSYLGQFLRVDEGVTIGSMSVIDREVKISSGVEIGRQGHVGRATHINTDAWLDDSVRIGKYGYLGSDTAIGEMTTIGDYPHIGNGSFVGAESRLGRLVRVAQNVILVSPTYADDGAFISESNFSVARPETP